MSMARFRSQSEIEAEAKREFAEERQRILAIVPNADVQHVGSTAVPGSLTKGDLDIQVRVNPEDFTQTASALSALYAPNTGNPPAPTYVSLKDDSLPIPLGVQLTTIGGPEDCFWILRDLLIQNPGLRIEYDALKQRFQGKSMAEYRKAKGEFFERLKETDGFKRLKEGHNAAEVFLISL